MPDYTPQHSIAYPLPNDRVKDANVAAKLAADIQATALTADAAITTEGQRAENAAKQAASNALSHTEQQINTKIDELEDRMQPKLTLISPGMYELAAPYLTNTSPGFYEIGA